MRQKPLFRKWRFWYNEDSGRGSFGSGAYAVQPLRRIGQLPDGSLHGLSLRQIFIDQDLCAFSDGAGDVEFLHFRFVGLSVSQLFFDGFHGAVAAFTEKRGQFVCAVLAAVAVFEFPVAEKFDLTAADRAVFFIE